MKSVAKIAKRSEMTSAVYRRRKANHQAKQSPEEEIVAYLMIFDDN